MHLCLFFVAVVWGALVIDFINFNEIHIAESTRQPILWRFMGFFIHFLVTLFRLILFFIHFFSNIYNQFYDFGLL